MIVTSYFMYLIKVTYQLREASRDTEIGDSNRWRSVTLTAWNDQGSDSGLELNALSPALVYSRSPFTMELPSSSQQPSPELISSVSNMSTSSSNGALSAVVRSKHSFVESYMYYKKHFTFSQALFILID